MATCILIGSLFYAIGLVYVFLGVVVEGDDEQTVS